MVARAVALLRDHPLLTPLLVVYAAINVLAVVFEFGLSNAPINFVLLVVYVSLIHFATRGRHPAVPAADRPNRRSRDIGLAIPGSERALAGRRPAVSGGQESRKRRDRRPTLAASDPGRGSCFPLPSR